MSDVGLHSDDGRSGRRVGREGEINKKFKKSRDHELKLKNLKRIVSAFLKIRLLMVVLAEIADTLMQYHSPLFLSVLVVMF